MEDQSKQYDSIQQLQAMRAGVDFRHTVKVKNYTLLLRPLAIMETVQIAGEVGAEMGKMPLAYRNSLTENCMMAKKTICRASTSDVGINDPQITEHILDRCTEEEIQFLYKQYIDVVRLTNPSMEEMSAEELEKLIAEVKKNPSQLTELSRWQLLRLVDSFLTKDE